VQAIADYAEEEPDEEQQQADALRGYLPTSFGEWVHKHALKCAILLPTAPNTLSAA
jgi:hypothetical protein